MFRTIWPKNFLCAKSHMGTPFEWNFSTHKKIFQLQVRAYLGVQIKKNSVQSKTFLYDSLETREFLWVKTPMGIQWCEVHFQAIFSLLRDSNESWSKLAINQLASSLVIANDFDWSKSPMGTVFLRVDPLPPGCVEKEQKNCFYEPKNRAASRHWVGANRYAKDLCASELLWV